MAFISIHIDNDIGELSFKDVRLSSCRNARGSANRNATEFTQAM